MKEPRNLQLPAVDSRDSSTGAVCERAVERVDAVGGRAAARDWLVVEAPLELRVAGEPVLVVMRTPGHDAELVRGLLFAEGAIRAGEPLPAMSEPPGLDGAERGNVLELGLAPGVLGARAIPAAAGCGVCGTRALADLAVRAPVIRSGLAMPAALVAELPERLRRTQSVFEATGGLHAAGAFAADGTVLAVREDVGRHNAVDKLVGWALGRGLLPMDDAVLCVSGRLGFEIAQKAIMAGFPVVIAVSAPSSLAVDLAERFRLTVCGFTRSGRFNVYAHPSRVG